MSSEYMSSEYISSESISIYKKTLNWSTAFDKESSISDRCKQQMSTREGMPDQGIHMPKLSDTCKLSDHIALQGKSSLLKEMRD